jgi:DNA polymerase (family 10)
VEEAERISGAEEEDVFSAVGLPWIPPVLREDRGEVEAAGGGGLPDLIELEQIRGDLQMHSTWSDGKQSLREMVEACRDRGYEYLSITDHSQAVTVAGGLKPEEVRAQWEEIEEVREEVSGIQLFRSLEIDILKDGSLDMPEDILRELDLVLVSVHSFMNMGKKEMTDRVVRALEHPQVDILAHPTGRILNRREPFELDVEAVLQAAASLDVAVELNAHPQRLDLHDRHLRRAKELGVKVAINTDAHSVRDLGYMSYGVDQGRRGWLEKEDVLNALPLEEFGGWVERRARG